MTARRSGVRVTALLAPAWEEPVCLLDGVGIHPQLGGEHPAGGQLVPVLNAPGHNAPFHMADNLHVDGDPLFQGKGCEGKQRRHLLIDVEIVLLG